MPDGSRFSTPTEPPNNERTRDAKGGPKPKSPPGVSASPIENSSKNFDKERLGIVRPSVSMTTRCGSSPLPRDSRTVAPFSENLTAVSSSARSALTSRSSHASTRSMCTAGIVNVTSRDSANAVALTIARLNAGCKKTGVHLNRSRLTSIVVRSKASSSMDVIRRRDPAKTSLSWLFSSVDDIPSKMISETPKMPLSGVRNSCEIRFKKSVLE